MANRSLWLYPKGSSVRVWLVWCQRRVCRARWAGVGFGASRWEDADRRRMDMMICDSVMRNAPNARPSSPCSVIPWHPTHRRGPLSTKPLTPSAHGRFMSETPSAGQGSVCVCCLVQVECHQRCTAIRGVFLTTELPHMAPIAQAASCWLAHHGFS